MGHIILKDLDNNKYQHMQNLREEVMHLIHNNIVELQKDGKNILAQSADLTLPKDWGVKLGLENDQGLYDRLIIDYSKRHPDKILQFWARHKY